MKRNLAFVAVVLAVACLLSACNFTSNFSDSTGMSKMKAVSEVEDMMEALSESDLNDAQELMHPSVTDDSENGLAQMGDYLAGRKVAELEQQGVRVNTSTGTGGKTRQEQGTFLVTLEDGAAFYISVVHLSDDAGEGFVSFQMMLGVV